MKNLFFILPVVVISAILFYSCQDNTISNPNDELSKKTGQYDIPTITCGEATQASINLIVTAGASGAPAGFSIHWMTLDEFTARNEVWPSSEEMCNASFSGNANLSRYNLGPNESVTINIGEFLFDEGASTNCDGALYCGTQYVFRIFAHATSTVNKSNFSGTFTCETLPCGSEEVCTLTQGYWKTHGAAGPGSEKIYDSDNNLIGYIDEWPVTSLTLGTVTYTETQLQAIFDQSAAGNGLIALAHQLIAAKLNIANGADDTDVAAAITAADALIGSLIVPPIGSGYLSPSATSALITTLTNYNEGTIGPGHCDE